MAEDFINEIYSKAELIYIYRQCLDLLTIKDLSRFSKLWSAYSGKILDIVCEMRNSDDVLATRLENMAFGVIGNIKDPMLAKELIEGGIIPILYQYIDKYRGIDVTEGEWQLKSSRSGYLTMYNNKLSCHIHSLDNPMWEARNEVKARYNGSYDRALLLGAGLGYTAKALWELSEGSIDIYIFEKDKCIEEYARMYGVIDSIAEDKLHYIVKEDMIDLYSEFLAMQIGEEKSLTLIQEWMAECVDEPIKSDIKTQIMSEWALISFENNYNINYWRNRKKFTGEWADLEGKYQGREFIVVAAGPSLDSNIQYIKNSVGSKIIICVNTVLKRMLKEGIKPDYVCLIDPTVGVFAHVDGVEDKTEDIPLIAESVAYWKFLDVYKGPIYRVFGAYYKEAIEEAKNIGARKIDIGSTVSNLVIEAAVCMGARRIEMIGMDLAFPGDKQYAGSNSAACKNNYQEYFSVKSADGGNVRTVDTYNIFRSDIEKQIFRNEEIEFENMSPNGALINGSYNGGWRQYKLSKLLPNRSDISDDNYRSLSRIGGLISCLEEGYKNHKDVLQKVLFDEFYSEGEKLKIIEILKKWYDYANSIHDTVAMLYLDTVLLTIEYDDKLATEFIKLISSTQMDYKERYFWYCQLKNKIENGDIENSVIINAYLDALKEAITDEVCSLISFEKNEDDMTAEYNNTCYVIVDQLSKEDIANGSEAFAFAEEAMEHGKKVLVINTAEKFPFGSFMPVYAETIRINDDELISNDSIIYKGKQIPYFQCESCMPDIGNIKLLLEFIQKTNPSEIMSYTDDSIVVWTMEKSYKSC